MAASADAARVRERRLDGDVPLFVLDDWRHRFPWLLAATTGAGEEEAFDLGLFGEAPVGPVLARWRTMMDHLDVPGAVHSRQAHGSLVQVHDVASDGLRITEGHDGHATTTAGLLLTISVADCVPVFLVDPETRAIAVLHAGWRGVAADVLEAGLDTLERLAGSSPDRVWMHAGPAICGRCYEVGPEVHEAIGLDRPSGPALLDLRDALAQRARRSGLKPDRVSVSEHCTRCGPGRFFSHRAGARGRQMALLAVLPDERARARAPRLRAF